MSLRRTKRAIISWAGSYNVRNCYWHWMNSQSSIFSGYGLSDVLKNSWIFEIFVAYPTCGFCFKAWLFSICPEGWITSPFNFSLSVRKVLIKSAIAWHVLYVGCPPPQPPRTPPPPLPTTNLHDNTYKFIIAEQLFRCKVSFWICPINDTVVHSVKSKY